MLVAGLIMILSVILLPVTALHAPLHERVVPVQTLTLSTSTVSATSVGGQVGTPLALSKIPTTTTSAQRMVGTPLHQPGTATSTASTIVGTAQAFSPSSGGIVGTPISQSQSYLDQNSIDGSIPNYAVLLIILICLFVFFSVAAFFVYRFYKRHHLDLQRKDLDDEEDIMAAYSRYWKKKQRHSGGGGFVDVKETQACAVHTEDKVQRRV
jgi:hypothetical protein